MLYIKWRTPGNFSDRGTVDFHIGEKMPKELSANVIEIQADGDELEHIQKKFIGLPQSFSSRVVTWFGDDAKFIIRNW